MTDKEVLHNKFGLKMKRVTDIIGSLIAIILFAPIMIVIVLLIKKNGTSAFFSQIRIGKNGKAFKCLKFQTMIPNASKELKTILENNPDLKTEWDKNFKLKNDPRVTSIGKFLRRTSLDELPQLFNILKGEMSMVGPRPVTRSEITNFYKKIQNADLFWINQNEPKVLDMP